MTDNMAEQAIRLAFEQLSVEGKVCNSVSIPNRAQKILGDTSPQKVLDEIDDMEARGALEAPLNKHESWHLIG
jgi:hypothetical protein